MYVSRKSKSSTIYELNFKFQPKTYTFLSGKGERSLVLCLVSSCGSSLTSSGNILKQYSIPLRTFLFKTYFDSLIPFAPMTAFTSLFSSMLEC